MSNHIRATSKGDVTTLALDRPEEGNRLTNAMAQALTAEVDKAQSSRVIVLRGTGADFCLGRSMQPPPPGSGARPLDIMRDDAGPMIEMFNAFRQRRQPVVAVIAGRAWGIGAVFAALADVTIAASNSTFKLGELERGIPPCIAMAPLLDRMPMKALAHLVYSAEEIDAAAALAAGIISRIAPPAELDSVTERFVDRMLSFPAEAVEAVKQYIATAPRFNEPNAALYGGSLLANVLASR